MHNNTIVVRHTTLTHYSFSVKSSLVGLIVRISISSTLSGARAGW